ncbi:hypothetical protein BGM26_20375 [Bacillus sp. FJAT-29790]|uniref:hypothetical protein n=1 Tax=Bacillus sp. FJAT-29790 TaxID=1895002 RepID=UPI001C229F92|nr:hypothetical protein [Bacillus sp. FJAT-29790]MBU8881280.1 hypothetical protein [Bacillus sp. FJAT-29790]
MNVEKGQVLIKPISGAIVLPRAFFAIASQLTSITSWLNFDELLRAALRRAKQSFLEYALAQEHCFLTISRKVNRSSDYVRNIV